MSVLKELLAKKAQLELEIQEARRGEAAGALDDVRQQVQIYGFTPDDVFGKPSTKVTRAPSTQLFRNPANGNTWTGRGRRPDWLKGKDIEQFRILS